MKAVTFVTIATGIATLIGAIAVNGQGAAEAVASFPKVLTAYANGLPFGLVSSVLAFAMACAVWQTARVRLTITKGGRDGRDFRADNLALATSLIVTFAQTLAAGRTDAYGLLTAGMLGIMGGLVAPWAMRGLRAGLCHAKSEPESGVGHGTEGEA